MRNVLVCSTWLQMEPGLATLIGDENKVSDTCSFCLHDFSKAAVSQVSWLPGYDLGNSRVEQIPPLPGPRGRRWELRVSWISFPSGSLGFGYRLLPLGRAWKPSVQLGAAGQSQAYNHPLLWVCSCPFQAYGMASPCAFICSPGGLCRYPLLSHCSGPLLKKGKCLPEAQRCSTADRWPGSLAGCTPGEALSTRWGWVKSDL